MAPRIPDINILDCQRRGGTYSHPYCNLPDSPTRTEAVVTGERPIFLINKCPMPLEVWVRRYTEAEEWVTSGPWRLAKDDFKSGRGPDQGAALLDGSIDDDPADGRGIAFHEAGQPIYVVVIGGIKNKTARWTELASDEWQTDVIVGVTANGDATRVPAVLVPVGRPFTHLRPDFRPRIGALINSLDGIGISLRCDPPGDLP